MVLYVDAMSVFAAVAATFVKTPAEKSLLSHVQFLRELLESGCLRHIAWLDTRDMAADGLTKGAVARDSLHQVMDGFMAIQNICKTWTPKKGGLAEPSPEGHSECRNA